MVSFIFYLFVAVVRLIDHLITIIFLLCWFPFMLMSLPYWIGLVIRHSKSSGSTTYDLAYNLNQSDLEQTKFYPNFLQPFCWFNENRSLFWTPVRFIVMIGGITLWEATFHYFGNCVRYLEPTGGAGNSILHDVYATVTGVFI